MTNRQKIELRLSAVKVRLNEISLLEGDALTDEVRAEAGKLQDRVQGPWKLRFQAAVSTEGETRTRTTESTEDRQRRELVDGSDMGRIFGAILEHRQVDGREQEMQTEFGLASNQVPLAMLRGEEHRAVTPAPANVGATQAAIIPGVFPDSVAAFLGVDMPTVGVGEAVFPVLTKNAEVKTPAENAEADETDGQLFGRSSDPGQAPGVLFLQPRGSGQVCRHGCGPAIRTSTKPFRTRLTRQVVVGDDGLLDGTNLANHNVTAQLPRMHSIAPNSRMGARRRHLCHFGRSDLRIVMGSGYLRPRGQRSTGETTITRMRWQSLMAATGGNPGESAHVPAASFQQAKRHRPVWGSRRDAVAAIWQGISLIPDEITKAKSGQVVITAVMLHAVKILQSPADSTNSRPSTPKFPGGWLASYLPGALQVSLIRLPGATKGGGTCVAMHSTPAPFSLRAPMPNILLSGPAGSGKSAVAREMVEEDSSELVLVADIQSIVAALTLVRRDPETGKYPVRDERVLPTAEYIRRAIISAAVARQIRVITTNSDGSQDRRDQLLSLLGAGAVERVIDPGEAVVAARLSDSRTGELSSACQGAVRALV